MLADNFGLINAPAQHLPCHTLLPALMLRPLSAACRWLADNFGLINNNVPRLLNTVNFFHSIVGPTPLAWASKMLNSLTANAVPVWNPYMPKGAAPLQGK